MHLPVCPTCTCCLFVLPMFSPCIHSTQLTWVTCCPSSHTHLLCMPPQTLHHLLPFIPHHPIHSFCINTAEFTQLFILDPLLHTSRCIDSAYMPNHSMIPFLSHLSILYMHFHSFCTDITLPTLCPVNSIYTSSYLKQFNSCLLQDRQFPRGGGVITAVTPTIYKQSPVTEGGLIWYMHGLFSHLTPQVHDSLLYFHFPFLGQGSPIAKISTLF